jgi:hypothetical protein
MMVPLWVAELADAFWEAAGMREPFPRALRRPVARAVPMAIVSLPRLRLRDVLDWLQRHDIECPCTATDRSLHACLAAWGGWGYVFLDGADPEDEQRLSLAHELAHFLRHYRQPRQAASRNLGEQVLEVLDGRRPPTRAERVHALLASVPIGCHLHLLGRDPGGGFSAGTVLAAEDEADRLAYELLAPAEEVLSRAGPLPKPDPAELLRTDFGLPAAHARRYGDILFPPAPADPLLRRLGMG